MFTGRTTTKVTVET